MASSSEKLTFPNREGIELAGRLELPAGQPLAFALFAHCFTCSKDIAAAGRISRALGRKGIAVLRFDFTGIGNSDGDFANTDFTSNQKDLAAAADFLREHHQAPQLLVGHSLGGAAVLGVASEIPEVRAVCTIGAPSDPSHVLGLMEDRIERIEAEGCAQVELGGRRFEITKAFLDSLDDRTFSDRIRRLDAALLVLHAPLDETVGIDEARKIYEAAKHPKSFVTLDGADHLLSNVEDSEYVAEILAAWAPRYLDVPFPSGDDAVLARGGHLTDSPVPDGTVVVEEFRGLEQRVRAGVHLLVADEPVKVGGTDLGPDPYELLLASLGACTSMTLRIYAKHKGLDLSRIEVTLKHERIHARDCEDCESETGYVDRITRELLVEGDLSSEQRIRLLEIADRCPVHRTLLVNEKKIKTRWKE